MINDLLGEFLYLFEQCDDTKFDKSVLLTSNDYLELSSKIKSFFSQYNEDIESEFSSFLEQVENDKDLNYSDIEQFVDELRTKLDKDIYRTGYDFQEGIYASANESLNIGAEWTSKSAIRFTNPSISVHQRPHKKNGEKTFDKLLNAATPETIDSFSKSYRIITPDTTIEELELSIREFNYLKSIGVYFISDLLNYKKENECCRQIGQTDGSTLIEKIIANIRKQVDDFEKLKDDCINSENTSIITPKSINLDSPIEVLKLSDIAYKPLKREGAKLIRDIFDFINGTSYCRSLGRKGLEEIINTLENHNLTEKLKCVSCGTFLTSEDIESKHTTCENCYERIMRTLNATDIVLEVLPPEKSSYFGGETGFHIYVNIKNNTAKPIKLELKECSIFKNGRQNSSNYNLTGYTFNEDYIFPTTVKTFAKIWITDKWPNKDINYFDCLTVSFKNVGNGELYYYKFNYSVKDASWLFTDFYKMN